MSLNWKWTLAAAVAVALLGGLWSTVQYSKNQRAVSAARELGTVVPSTAELPTAETLHRLETLRAHLGRLSAWGRWWFYKGTGMYADLRQIYMDRFDRILLEPARASMLGALDSLPDAPNATAQYGRAYQTLKAYLMTTSHPERMSPSFLVPVLKDRWLNGRQIDPERTELAERQFDFYASTLCRAAGCGRDATAGTVDRTRAFLAKFTGADRMRLLLADQGQGKGRAPARAWRRSLGTPPC